MGTSEMVQRALPGLGFDIRRQASIYRDKKALGLKVLSASQIKNVHHLIGEILGESMRGEHARSADIRLTTYRYTGRQLTTSMSYPLS